MKTLSLNQFITPKKMSLFGQLLLTVIGTVLLVFLFLALLSYDKTDSAWSHIGSNPEIANVAGRMGAWVADILHTFFGYGAWFLVLVLAYELARLWWSHAKLLWVLRVSAYALLLAFISALLAYMGDFRDNGLAASLGGAMGFELQKNLVINLGASVTALALIALIGIIAALSFEIRWANVAAMIMDWVGQARPKADNEQTPVAEVPKQPVADDVDEPIDDVVQAHNHHGALESFLCHSGLRDELIAKRQAEQDAAAQRVLDEQIALQTQAISLSEQMPSDDKNPAWQYESDDEPNPYSTVADEHIINEASISLTLTDEPKIQPDEAVPSTVDRYNQLGKLRIDSADVDANHQPQTTVSAKSYEPMPELVDEPLDEPNDTAAWENEPSQAGGQPKSYAMGKLAYRMSLSPIPELTLLDTPDYQNKPKVSEAKLKEASELLEIKLQEYNIQAQVMAATVGPVVTRFEVALAAGVKASRVTREARDLARNMLKESLRVIEVIPGKPYIGIEVPNEKREMVRLIELLDTPDYQDPDKQIAIAVGKDISGKVVIADLAKAPHMLVAGTTGSGKSVLVNSFLLSMLLKYTPDELKLVLIDPKQLELANYNDIPHLLTPVITDMQDAVAALTWCVNEMERRYRLMSKLRVRKIAEFNKKIIQAEQSGESIYDPLWQANDSVSQSKPPKLKTLPIIVIVADEFADMIMQLGKTAEEPIVRLAQKARAAGIHLLLATQRPTVNVVTGLIKANVPSRVALRVNTKVDSRTIIEEGGAEDMLGNGDMMFIAPGKNSAERVHGAYVDDDEVNRVCDAWRERGSPDYIDLSESYTFDGEGSGDTSSVADGDQLYEAAAAYVVETRKPSISSVQRKFSIGYNRAARLLDQMQERGLVSAMDNSGKRQLLL